MEHIVVVGVERDRLFRGVNADTAKRVLRVRDERDGVHEVRLVAVGRQRLREVRECFLVDIRLHRVDVDQRVALGDGILDAHRFRVRQAARHAEHGRRRALELVGGFRVVVTDVAVDIDRVGALVIQIVRLWTSAHSSFVGRSHALDHEVAAQLGRDQRDVDVDERDLVLGSRSNSAFSNAHLGGQGICALSALRD